MIKSVAGVFKPPVFPDADTTRNAAILNTILLALLIASIPALMVSFPFGTNNDPLEFAAVVLIAVVTLGSLWLLRRGKFGLGRYGIPVLFFLTISYSVYEGDGIHDASAFGFWLVVALASLLMGKRAPLIFGTLSIFSLSFVYYLETEGQITITKQPPNPIDDLIVLGIFVFLSTVLLRAMMGNMEGLLHRARQNEAEVRKLNEGLEEQVAARTRDLQIAAQVATQITTVLDLKELLPHIVQLTKDGFELYHVSVFLYDEESQELRYEAGTDEAGSIMKARGKKFSLNDKGLVPRSARTKEPVSVGDVTTVADYYQEEALPKTRAELAVPMLIGDKLIGVLDLQSEELYRFTTDDMVVMQPLAKQVAIAVQNARLYAYQLAVAEQLRAVDDMKSQFLASMSHELRTPLNAILSFSKFIKMGVYGEANDQQVDAVQKIIGSADHLLALINDVLDITKIESGMMQLFVEDDLDLNGEMQTVVATARALVENKDVKIIEDIDTNLPIMVGDRRRVRQIFLNLVANACKFTEQGTVTISAKRKGDDLLFAVIDTGPGIAPENLDVIFEPFQQTATGIKHAGGTGLGLPISKKLAEAHGGRLWVDTQAGTGTSFFIRLPIQSETLRAMMEVPVGA